MNTENLSTFKIHKLTQAQYNRELEAGRIDENAMYLTPDDAVAQGSSIQISQESISAILPAGSYYFNVELNTPAAENEILVPVGTSSSNVFITLHSSSGNSNYADSITFHRAGGVTTNDALSVTCYLMRLKVING